MLNGLSHLDLGDAGIIPEGVDCVSWANATVHFIASGESVSSAAIEVLRSYDANGLTAESFSTPALLDVSSSAMTEINAVDIPFLFFRINTAEAGKHGRIIVRLYEPITAEYDELVIELDEIGIQAEILNDHDSITIKPWVNLGAMATGQAAVKYFLDPEHPIDFSPAKSWLSSDLDPKTFTNKAYAGLSVSCAAADVGQKLRLFVYSRNNKPLPDNVAFTDQINSFSAIQYFGDRLVVGDISTGISTIDTASTGNSLIDLPNVSGTLAALLTTASPAANDRLVRSGNGYASVPDAGSTFPSSPYDGQAYTRTDLDMPEVFRWDAGRSKWLGELINIQIGRDNASSSSLDLDMAGVTASSARGMLSPYKMCIVGVQFYSAVTFTGDLDYYEGSSKVATIYSTTTKNGSDFTLNQSIDADLGWPQKHFKFTITSGSANNPIVDIFVRRDGTSL